MGVWRTLLGTSVGLLLGGPMGVLAGGASAEAATVRAASPERRQVAFTIAAIALAAKMARADGNASAAEFATFERLFRVPDGERANAARFYRLAQGSTAGFEAYASQAADLLGPGSPVLEDLLEALLLIAVTDGVHPAELDYLRVVAERLGFDAAAYARIRARYIAPGADDPYVVLGVTPGAGPEELRAAYRALVKTYHPDRHHAEGTPPEFLRVAEARMAAINAAYAAVTARGARTA
ncbi:MAG: TerB family tellurite resistance protein [Sphingomonadaceae bacterium]|nr:TerB family tellurite resistance protein [Sphingomonadaceae bacterium]